MMNKKQQTLIITAKNEKELGKDQQAFNKLIKQIESLSRKKEREEEKLNKLHDFYSQEILGLENLLAKDQLKMALELNNATKKYNYSARQKDVFEFVILYLCDLAFGTVMPNEEEEAMYDRWSQSSYQEELNEEEELMKKSMREELKFTYGIDIDFSEYDGSPEGFAKFKEQFEEALNNKEQEEIQSNRSAKKKTKKQLEKELLKKEQEALELKSLRSIYISLAKVLHPDTNNELENAKKEELMKRVTKAYSEKNLPELLKLEMEWAAAEHNNLDSLGNDKLKLYISSLKNRVKELKEELQMIYHNPKYINVFEWAKKSEKVAAKDLTNLKFQIQIHVDQIQSDLKELQKMNKKQDILAFANELYDIINPEYDESDEFDLEFLFESMLKK